MQGIIPPRLSRLTLFADAWVARPNAVMIERLGWRAHTVRQEDVMAKRRPNVYRIVDVVGESSTSWGPDAAPSK
jgi:hypothetical protein